MPDPARPGDHARRHARRARTLLRAVPILLVGSALVAGPALATSAVPDDDTLRAGAEAYQAYCSGCHQPGGVGISGQFPPLKDNPNVQDAAYVRDVIANGRSGEIVVAGVTYNGVMPAQSTVGDADVDLIVTYVQSGFLAPSAPAPEIDTGPVAGTELPIFANWMSLVGIGLAAVAILFVFAPRIISAHDHRSMPWLDAWFKTAIIVGGMIAATTIIPARVLEFETVRELPRVGQDVIAVALWLGGLGGGLWALWYAHREKRI